MVMSGQRDIQLLVSDVDGTLLTHDKVLTDAAIAAAQNLLRAGIRLAIASSRPPRALTMLIERLGLLGPIAGCNGGVYVNPDLSVIESHTIDPATARQSVKLFLEDGLDVWVYAGDEWLVRDKNGPFVERETFTLQFDATVVPAFTGAHLDHALKVVGISDDIALVGACEAKTRIALGDSASVARSNPNFLDVTHPNANKGAVVTTLSRLLNIPRERIATIGDGSNDVLMFHQSGFSVAMGNATDEVKAEASVVTDNSENEGFANAVWKFILPAAPG
jgi:Cof subfamily protein (haloacid dehalogenase superfamily)